MANLSITRTDKAAGIVERQELAPIDVPGLEGLWQVRDTRGGSGQLHITSASQCDCYDARRRDTCKHMLAVRAEEARLRQYAAAWDAWAAAQAPPCCSACGAVFSVQQHYIGGRGYVFFDVCPAGCLPSV